MKRNKLASAAGPWCPMETFPKGEEPLLLMSKYGHPEVYWIIGFTSHVFHIAIAWARINPPASEEK